MLMTNPKGAVFFLTYWCKVLCCFQTEECMTLLKKLSSADAERVVEHLTIWARLQLEDKVHISEEVRRVSASYIGN